VDRIRELKMCYKGNKISPSAISSTASSDTRKKAMDPRDYVYGLLGLVSESHGTKISPDYTLNVAEVLCVRSSNDHTFAQSPKSK
jgi:hypothetical protein